MSIWGDLGASGPKRVETAYARSDLSKRQRVLMDDRADYLASQSRRSARVANLLACQLLQCDATSRGGLEAAILSVQAVSASALERYCYDLGSERRM